MKKAIGLWIDLRSAVIVTVADGKVNLQRVPSNIRRRPRPTNTSRFQSQFGLRQLTAEAKHENEFLGHLNQYYDEVIGHLRDADSILIFGPGEAKTQLKKRLEGEKLDERIVGLETTDRLTEPQIRAKVEKHFAT